MDTKKKILEMIEKQIEIEKKAKDSYNLLIKNIKNRALSNKLKEMAEDKITHIALLDEISLSFLSYRKDLKRAKKQEDNKENDKIEHALDSANAILITMGLDEYFTRVLDILEKARDKKVIYISYSKIPTYIKKLLNEKGLNTRNIQFINCTGENEKEGVNIDPVNLTRISIETTRTLGNKKNGIVIFDTLTSLTSHNNVSVIRKFVSVMNDKARDKGHKMIWIGINETDDETLNNKISELCDKTIRV